VAVPEIPPRVRRAVGLGDEPNWVIVSEHNVDEWANAGLQPVPGRPGIFSYGFVQPRLLAEIKRRFLDLARRNRSPGVRC